MALPNPGMDAVPFTPLTAEFLDDMIENIESLSDGTGFQNGAITTNTLAESAATASKINWATFSRFSAYRNAALANAGTTIVFDAENYDIGNNYDTSNGRYTAPVAGHYHFDAQITLSASYSNYIWANILVNGSARHRGQRLSSSNTNGMSVVVSADVQLNAGDYVQISCAMGASAAAEVGNVGGSMTWFMGRLVALN